MSIKADIQSLEPGHIVELFELDLNPIGVAEVYRFHAGVNELGDNVVWDGKTYTRFPVEADGFEKRGQGTMPRPSFRIANITGLISAAARENGDLIGAKLTRIRTFVKYLDAVNFAAEPSLICDFLSPTLNPRITYTRTGPKTYFDKDGILQTAVDNEWPLEHNPATLEPVGRSVWEARTNLLTHSEEFDNAAWSKSSAITVIGNAALAPDGTTTACAIQGTSETAIKRVYQWHATSDQGPWTFSVFLKAGTEKNALVNIIGMNSGVTVGQLRGRVHLETGTFSAVESEGIGSGATITLLQELPGGWWRVGITGRFVGGLTHVRGEVWLDGYTSTTSTGNLYAWGAQLEAGSSASPYIPTAGSAVTRSADVVSITGADFSSWFNPDEGTFVVEGSSTRTDSNITFVQARDASNSGEVRILRGMTGAYASLLFVRDDSIGQALNVPQVGTPIDGTTYKIAAAYKRNDLAISRDGAAPTTHTAAEVPGGLDRLFIGSNSGSAQFINGHIRSVIYYPHRLSNAELPHLPNAYNGTADPNQYLDREIWFIDRKSAENKVFVEFELSAAFDVAGVLLPRRQCIQNVCTWAYRSAECGYTGGPVADRNDEPVTDLADDVCGKRLSSCRLRFGQYAPLPFGGFPGAGLVR